MTFRATHSSPKHGFRPSLTLALLLLRPQAQ
jgi:hypothetical protein